MDNTKKNKENELYSLSNGQLIILDNSLHINIQEPFSPPMLPEKITGTTLLPSKHMLRYNRYPDYISCYLEKNGIFDGEAKTYYLNGTTKTHSFYSNGLLHGPSTSYNDDGILITQSWFFHGMPQGKTLWYYPSGQLYAIQRFVNGQLEGLQEYFFENGNKKTNSHYSQGKLKDTQLYHPNQMLKKEVTS